MNGPLAYPHLLTVIPICQKICLDHAFKIIYDLQTYLSEIGGFYNTSLMPAAGAQGEFAGLAMITKALADRGEVRKKILVPRSAHGTNPATATFFSYEVVSLDIANDGRMNLSQVKDLMDDDCIGLMVTNPNTLGILNSTSLRSRNCS